MRPPSLAASFPCEIVVRRFWHDCDIVLCRSEFRLRPLSGRVAETAGGRGLTLNRHSSVVEPANHWCALRKPLAGRLQLPVFPGRGRARPSRRGAPMCVLAQYADLQLLKTSAFSG